MWIRVCVHDWYPCRIFLCHSPLILPDRVSHWTWNSPVWLSWLASGPRRQIHLSQPSALRRAPLTGGVLTWVLDDETQLSVLMWQAVYLLSHLPTLAVSIYWNMLCIRGSTIVSCHSKRFISFSHRKDCQQLPKKRNYQSLKPFHSVEALWVKLGILRTSTVQEEFEAILQGLKVLANDCSLSETLQVPRVCILTYQAYFSSSEFWVRWDLALLIRRETIHTYLVIVQLAQEDFWLALSWKYHAALY